MLRSYENLHSIISPNIINYDKTGLVLFYCTFLHFSLQVNTSSRRTSPSLLFATTSSRSNLLEPTFAGVTFPTGSILSNLQVSCLHVSAASCDDGSSTGNCLQGCFGYFFIFNVN